MSDTLTPYYEYLAQRAQLANAGGFDPTHMPDHLFDFQRVLVEFAVEILRLRNGLFAGQFQSLDLAAEVKAQSEAWRFVDKRDFLGGVREMLHDRLRKRAVVGGYFPADDKTGFVALDSFDTNGGQRSTSDLIQGYAEGTLNRALRDFRQTATIRTDDSSRIEYTASAEGKAGRGVVVVRRIGDFACGVTLFALEGSPIAFDQTLDYLLSSLQLARP